MSAALTLRATRMTLPVAHYAARVAYNREADAARTRVTAERQAHASWQDSLAARDEAIRKLYDAMARTDPDKVPSPTEIASLTGLHASTVRAVTRDLARALRSRK